MKKTLQAFAKYFGYKISRIDRFSNLPVELTAGEVEIIREVVSNDYSMASIPALVNTVKSCGYILRNGIPGDFVECGVWRGGNGIIARKIFDLHNSERLVWMFDTFQGMTPPTKHDFSGRTGHSANKKYQKTHREWGSDWCFASLEDVQQNCQTACGSINGFKFVKGDVVQTLRNHDDLPEEIAILRLDTDWYESTKAELEVLYPKLSASGILVADDYGAWAGQRKAIDDFFSGHNKTPYLNVIDFSARSLVKI